MCSKTRFVEGALAFMILLMSTGPAPDATAANMRNFIEAVRRKATVVYIGSVREVHVLARTKFDIKARAVVDISAIARGPVAKPATGIVEYSSYDNDTPVLAGGPQYQLQPGTLVVIFAESFESPIPPGYLLQGSREELRERVKGLRDSLNQMSGAELKRNEIDEDDRQIELTLYEK